VTESSTSVDSADLVRYEVVDGVARITLDSPRNRNALSTRMLRSLRERFTVAARDPAVRIVVLSGTGPVFCSGADLVEQRQRNERGGEPIAALLADVLERMSNCPKPIVGRVNGSARAGGLGLIGACDIAVAPQEATFGFAEVRIGVVPAVIAVTVLPRLAPRIAVELFLTGETFDGRRAAQVGLVNRAVAAEDLDAEIDRYLGMLRQGGPEAVTQVKRLIRRVRELPESQAFAEMAALSAERFGCAEAEEGMRAFVEKRPPSWVVNPT
jgi:methylglutaconyl-CoA hydratase